MRETQACEEIVAFLARTSPEKVIAFQPSEAARTRVADLVRREKMEDLNPDERSELEHCLRIEHLMRLAKARARQHLREG